MYNEWNEGISAKLRFVRSRELYKSSKKLGLEIKKLIHFVMKFISLTVILMNIQYISTSTEHIYYITASTKLQPSVPRDYNARQMHRSNRFDEESLCGVYLAAFRVDIDHFQC
mgnify:CR=1 FL=1